jgi:hypothetical protein
VHLLAFIRMNRSDILRHTRGRRRSIAMLTVAQEVAGHLRVCRNLSARFFNSHEAGNTASIAASGESAAIDSSGIRLLLRSGRNRFENSAMDVLKQLFGSGQLVLKGGPPSLGQRNVGSTRKVV